MTPATSLPARSDHTALQVTYTPAGTAANAVRLGDRAPATSTSSASRRASPSAPADTATIDDEPVEVTATGTTGGGAVTIGPPRQRVHGRRPQHRHGRCRDRHDHRRRPRASSRPTRPRPPPTSPPPVAQRSVTVARRTPAIAWTPAVEITYGATLADLLDASHRRRPAPGSTASTASRSTSPTTPDAGDGQVLDVVFTPDDPDSLHDRHCLPRPRRAPGDPAPQRRSDRRPHLRRRPLRGRRHQRRTGRHHRHRLRPLHPRRPGRDRRGRRCLRGHRPASPATATTRPRTRSSAPSTIAKGTPELSWDEPADLTYGDAIGPDELDASIDAVIDPSAAAPVGDLTYTLAEDNPAEGVVLDAGDHVLHVRWEPVRRRAPTAGSPSPGSVTVHVDRSCRPSRGPTPAAIVSAPRSATSSSTPP